MTLLLSSADGMVLNATLAAPLQQPGNRALSGVIFTVNGGVGWTCLLLKAAATLCPTPARLPRQGVTPACVC